jgi:hypothetical protein
LWACGAAGSALPWHGRGHRFDPDQVHQPHLLVVNRSFHRRCWAKTQTIKTRRRRHLREGKLASSSLFRALGSRRRFAIAFFLAFALLLLWLAASLFAGRFSGDRFKSRPAVLSGRGLFGRASLCGCFRGLLSSCHTEVRVTP